MLRRRNLLLSASAFALLSAHGNAALPSSQKKTVCLFPYGAGYGTYVSPAPLSMDFSSSIPPDLTYSRGSAASYIDSVSGNVVDVASGTPRFDSALGLLLESQSKNFISNPRLSGAVVGTPGTLPTGWSILAGAGISTSVVAIGVENGMEYIDIRFWTPTVGASTQFIMYTDGATSVPLTGSGGVGPNGGETFISDSIFLKLVAGSWNNLGGTNVKIGHSETNAGGTVVRFSGYAPSSPNYPDSTTPLTKQRYWGRATAINTAINTRGTINILGINGLVVDITLRIGHMQTEWGLPTSPIRTPTTAPVAGGPTRNGDTLLTTTTGKSWWDGINASIYVSGTMASMVGGTGGGVNINSRSFCPFLFQDGTANPNTGTPPQNCCGAQLGGTSLYGLVLNSALAGAGSNFGNYAYQQPLSGSISFQIAFTENGSTPENMIASNNIAAQQGIAQIARSGVIYDFSNFTKLVFAEAPYSPLYLTQGGCGCQTVPWYLKTAKVWNKKLTASECIALCS